MKSIHATFRDGRIELGSEVDWPSGIEVEVIPLGTRRAWPEGYFEQTAGALDGERFERPEQGTAQARESW